MRTSIILAVLTLVILAGCGTTVQAAGKYDDFAKCLTQNGVKMYGAYWCPHCQNQKKLFGSSFQYVTYVECSLPNNAGRTDICIKENVDTYPTWIFKNGTRMVGELSVIDLSDKSGCDLELIKV